MKPNTMRTMITRFSIREQFAQRRSVHVSNHSQQLKQNLTRDKQADLDKNKTEIIELLESEIAKRYYFQKAEYEMAAKHDEDVKVAIKLLNDLPRYNSILGKKQ